MDNANLPARRRLRRGSLLLVAPILALLVLTGCGSGSSGSTASGDMAGGSGTSELGNTGNALPAKAARAASAPEAQDAADVQQRAVISTGRIELTSDDVASTRTRLDTVVGREGGRVADEDTITNDRGTVTRTHVVVRVPSARFDDAMTGLAGLANLRSSSRSAQDVTTRVIDLKARIAAERAGVRRLRDLVSQTASLPALLAVERALTQRQGELESLEQQRVYLADQTSLATITVDVTRQTAPPTPPEASAGGFVGGLHHGWNALVAIVVGLLIALGAVLPFAVAGSLVGLPTWLVVRQRRTRQRRAPVES